MSIQDVRVLIEYSLELDTDQREGYPDDIFTANMSDAEIACAMAEFDAGQEEPFFVFGGDEQFVSARVADDQ